ncbi:hypothetical protein Tco_1148657 [Tanacetum coccineum]
MDSSLAVPVFKQGDDPIDAINKMMSFLSTVVTSNFTSTNNQLRNSSNIRQQATIHDGRVTVQPFQGRQNSYVVGTSGTRANTSRTGGNYSGQPRIVKCFNLDVRKPVNQFRFWFGQQEPVSVNKPVETGLEETKTGLKLVCVRVPSLLASSAISSSDSGMASFHCTSSSKTSSSKSKGSSRGLSSCRHSPSMK